MSSARELLEQADALMRRNRRPPPGEDLPELTDVVPAAALPRIERSRVGAVPATVGAATSIDDIPELTEAVEEIEAPSIQELPDDSEALSRWLQENEPDRGAADLAPDPIPATFPATPAPHAPSAVAAAAESAAPEGAGAPVAADPWTGAPAFDEGSRRDAVSAQEIFGDDAVFAASGIEADGSGPPIDVDDPERWKALAEEIRMQVLQRIDIFTDTGLREQLTARLQPVVDRASAALVATINRAVGHLLRASVAEAVEREIEHWRHGGG